jgi:hypothetical protein
MALALAASAASSGHQDCADLVVIGRVVGEEWRKVEPDPCKERDCIFLDALFTSKMEVDRVVRGHPQNLSVEGTRVQHTKLNRRYKWVLAIREGQGGVNWIVRADYAGRVSELESAWKKNPVPAC